jgi:hypothetical protein
MAKNESVPPSNPEQATPQIDPVVPVSIPVKPAPALTAVFMKPGVTYTTNTPEFLVLGFQQEATYVFSLTVEDDLGVISPAASISVDVDDSAV